MPTEEDNLPSTTWTPKYEGIALENSGQFIACTSNTHVDHGYIIYSAIYTKSFDEVDQNLAETRYQVWDIDNTYSYITLGSDRRAVFGLERKGKDDFNIIFTELPPFLSKDALEKEIKKINMNIICLFQLYTPSPNSDFTKVCLLVNGSTVGDTSQHTSRNSVYFDQNATAHLSDFVVSQIATQCVLNLAAV
ncbi:hypothetical protein TrispH2_008892 [Trichoplax sp. H2]|uniref:Uncharacterized protein n=1 Tax=Trichoplax adhaerens TaxID=10228 RepID=B3SBR0_TRIAD|nr:predicted protein [Trichoplax adhaerens]EDV19836.1 predicted protein [Trichoplax adhaerens]RDD39291.1 hypothetical protein TrispH2_008892 [Trichoplax sp. H2]|eukprot:XP_002117706.1 predicted protein [Trichoplax adhaerens]